MILLLDNLDSFTYNLRDYLAQLGVICKVYRNTHSPDEIISRPYQAVVFSPGAGRPAQAGCLMKLMHYYHDKIPILGICLGHQAIGEYFGARLEKARKPMHGKISRVVTTSVPLFKGLKQKTDVVRYHSLILKDLPAELEVIAVSEEREVMAVQHRSWPISGLQFHPEALLTVDGFDILKNWARIHRLSH